MMCVCAGRASADPLNPLDFPFVASGVQTLGAGAYTLDTGSDTPFLIGPVFLAGEVTLQGDEPGIAVFSFESLNIAAGATINVIGLRPLALLARDNLTFAGTINADGGDGHDSGEGGAVGSAGGIGRAGGRNGGRGGGSILEGTDGRGAGGGRTGRRYLGTVAGGGGAGGGFGGSGMPGFSINGPGGAPGASYGNLLLELEGGSGGGGGSFHGGRSGDGGGAGGGAVELGALGEVNMTGGIISANGGNHGDSVVGGHGFPGDGGGGSGGGVFLHGGTVTRSGNTINAAGGGNFLGYGGGGRVAIQSGNATADTAGINVASGGTGAGDGIITIAQAILAASDLDFGPVRVGEAKTASMGVQNTGDPDAAVNGLFPNATGEFAGGNDVFSSLKVGNPQASLYTYTPTGLGEDSLVLQFLSNGGDPNVMLTGTGVGPVIGSTVAPGAAIDVGGVGPRGVKSAALDVSNVTLSDPYLPNELIGLTLLGYDITGPDAALFDLGGFVSGEVLSASDLSALDVMLSGDGVLGPKSASLTIMTDEDAPFGGTGNSVTYSLSGIVVPGPGAGIVGLVLFGVMGSVRRRRAA